MKKFICLISAALSVPFVATAAAPETAASQTKPQREVYSWTIPELSFAYNADNANFRRYAKANAQTAAKPPRAVFMGDSITDGWARVRPEFFAKNNFAGRGISGQVTSQMLVRFRRDVVDLHPKTVLILAGTNDVARNAGYISEENIAGNIMSMCEIAKANGIEPIICSILPAAQYKWRPVIKSVKPIKRINAMLKEYAQKNSIKYLDYYSALADENCGLSPERAKDGVHPTPACYAEMEKMVLDILN